MSATMLIIRYQLSDIQKGLSAEQWRERAGQIGVMKGLRWKYWLRDPDGDARGGVYLFDDRPAAEAAGDLLTAGLRQAGARDVTHEVFEVDGDLSAITRAVI